VLDYFIIVRSAEKVMLLSDKGYDRRFPLQLLFALLIVAPTVKALGDKEVAELGEKCEAAREIALTPIRDQRIQACIEQKLRQPDHCRRYYKTYGNVTVRGGVTPVMGYFYDLPECVEWIDAREALRVSRSRN
jgi:hypothetical protein